MTTKEVSRIALIGPESTGKTTLCMQLAEHFRTAWVPEYAREYVESLQRKYTLEDVEYCAKKQMELEDETATAADRFLFCDTELIIAKVWCEDVFKNCPPWIEAEIDKRSFDFYLLTFPDLPFEEDPVRENSHRREYFFNLYKKELESRGFDFAIITGTGTERVTNALNAIGKRFSKK